MDLTILRMGQIYDLPSVVAWLLVSEGWAEPAPWLDAPAPKEKIGNP